LISMIGPAAIDQRVYVIQVPPSGNYIVGFVINTSVGSFWTARITLSASTSSVIMPPIPPGLRSLTAKWTARGDNASNTITVFLRINNDSTASYNAENGIATAGAIVGSATLGATSATIGFTVGSLATAGMYGSGTCDFVGWDRPHSGFLGFTAQSQAMITGGVATFGGGTYTNTPAVPYALITFLPSAGNFVAGSDFQLIGEWN
jgi:hypothetical protein